MASPANPVEKRFYPQRWCLRSEVMQFLSNNQPGSNRYLLPELARLVANYLPDTIIFWSIWTTSLFPTRLKPARVQACALRMTSDFMTNYPEPEPIDLDDPKCVSGSWPPQPSWLNPDPCVDHKRHVGYVINLCERHDWHVDSRQLSIWGIDLAAGRLWQVLIPGSVSAWDLRFGVSSVILNDSMWIIGKPFRTAPTSNTDSDAENQSAHYDLSTGTWDITPMVGVAPIQFAAYVAISHKLVVVSGGYVDKTTATRDPGDARKRLYSDSCYLLEEKQNALGVRTLGVKQQLPKLICARANHGMAFIPDVSAIVAIEGTILGGGCYGWTYASEILSLLPLKRDRPKLIESETSEPSEAWCWHDLPRLPVFLSTEHRSVFGVGDNVIVLSKYGLFRLRVCGDCAAKMCARASHPDDYTAWQKLSTLAEIPQHYSIALFSIRDTNFS
jgi:hypothetical protein